MAASGAFRLNVTADSERAVWALVTALRSAIEAGLKHPRTAPRGARRAA